MPSPHSLSWILAGAMSLALALGSAGCSGCQEDGPDDPPRDDLSMPDASSEMSMSPDQDLPEEDMDPEDMSEDELPDFELPEQPDEPFARNDLQWKRWHALSRDLSAALALPVESVCRELNRFDCFELHLVPLGGNDPFAKGLYRPLEEPLGTTPAAVDRVVAHACKQRVTDDQAAAEPEVFTELDLASAVDPTDPAIDAQLTILYERLLARDPLPEELTTLRQLALDDQGQPVSGADFAFLSCYALGTTTEFLFF